MEPKSKIINVLKNIELQEEAINDLKQIKDENKITELSPDEDIEIISNNLENDQKSLHNLQREYSQRMLGRLVRNGIEDDEMMAWWMNRY